MKPWCKFPIAGTCWLAVTLASCSPREALKVAAANEYVDARKCAQCHAEIARKYSRTGMARSFQVPDTASVPDTKPYFHRASGTWFQLVRRDDAWYQKWWQPGWKGRDDTAGEQKIDYVMGSGNHVRTYLHRTARGTLLELPLAWYAEKGGRLALNPGFDMSDPPMGRKIGYDCMFCHNSYPAIPAGHDDAGAEPLYTGELPQGIDCQRCHGPGGNHLRAVSVAGAKAADIRSAIENPARLSPPRVPQDRAMEVCMQCHLETTSGPLPNAIRRYDRGPFSFRPGEALSAFQLTFDHAPGTGREAKFEIVSSVYRLRQSKCFLQSKGDLNCTTCHDPHEASHSSTDRYDQACARCHEPAKIAAKGHPAGGSCVGCHMPKRRAEDVVHTVMTDHLIQRPPPPNLLAELAERHDAGLEYKGEVVPYGGAADRDDLYTAVAQVSHKSNLDGGIPRLQTEIARRKPERPEFYMELGDALERAGRPEEAASAYRVALGKKPGSALLWARLAMPLRALGKSQEPLEALRKSLEADPNQPEVWYNLGLLQSDLGDKKAAMESYRKSISLDPEFAGSRTSLGAELAAAGQTADAEAELRAALRLRPALQAAHVQLAYLLANRGDLEEAVWHFERAGDNAVHQYSYGITLARMNRLAEARVHLQKSVDADTNQPLAHEVLGRLLEAGGKVPEAVEHYKAAIRLRPDFGKAHVDLGAVLLRRGDRAGAMAEFAFGQADPDPEVRNVAMAGLAAARGR